MKKKKVYLSGKITHNPLFVSEFKSFEKYLKRKGYKVYNPVRIVKRVGMSWEWYMKKDIKLLLKCDAIYLMPTWKYSKGAILEHDIASNLGLEVITGSWSDIDGIE